ncbi:MAG: hypothetical protein ACO1PI_15785 [Bacteroidota bacterium]
MGIIKELIDELSQSKTSLTEILMRTKVLAHKLKNEEMKEWVNNELDGYPPLADLPEYRLITCRIRGSISNGYRVQENFPIPILHLDDKIKNFLMKFSVKESVASLESFSSINNEKLLTSQILPEVYSLLSQNFTDDYQVISARQEISITSISQILTSIRSKLLDFLMDIGDIVDDENSIKPDEIEQAKSMFSSAVIGDNATIIVGNHNHQTVTNHITKGNFSELEKALKENKVDDKDIAELKAVIDTETPNTTNNTFGSKVNDWIKKMVGKAVDGTWKIGLAAAGKLLADSVGQYYGLK